MKTEEEKQAFETPFGRALDKAGLYCIDCIRAEDEEQWGEFETYLHKCDSPGKASDRFQKAYEIKKDHGFSNEEEVDVVAILNEVIELLKPADRDALWYEVHDRKDVNLFCLRPALWLIGRDLLQRHLAEISVGKLVTKQEYDAVRDQLLQARNALQEAPDG